MRVYTTFDEPKRRRAALVVGIGNFDGVHRGHVRIIELVRRRAGAAGTAGLITFSPHPRTVVKGEGEAVLTTLRQRLKLFRELGIEACWVVPFDRKLARQDPGRFAAGVLRDRLGVKEICVGEGYRFGRDRSGDVRRLVVLGEELGFTVNEVAAVRDRGVRVSSSAIRKLIGAGEVAAAARLLGRDYSLTGIVVRGEKLAERWGYPTANFAPEQQPPACGVYAARIAVRDILRDGVVYVGRRPTLFGERPRPLLAEAHIFDWEGSLYRRRIKVFLKKRVRGDITFNDLQSLFARVTIDVERARAMLGKQHVSKGA